MLDQDPEETFNGSHERAMDHDRAVGVSILTGKLQSEALGIVEVHLDRRALPGPAQHIFDLDIDLRTVEHALSRINAVGDAPALQGRFKPARGLRPRRFGTDGFLGSRGNVDLILVKAKRLQHEEHEVEHIGHFGLNLLWTAEQMGVVLRKAATRMSPCNTPERS